MSDAAAFFERERLAGKVRELVVPWVGEIHGLYDFDVAVSSRGASLALIWHDLSHDQLEAPLGTPEEIADVLRQHYDRLPRR